MSSSSSSTHEITGRAAEPFGGTSSSINGGPNLKYDADVCVVFVSGVFFLFSLRRCVLLRNGLLVSNRADAAEIHYVFSMKPTRRRLQNTSQTTTHHRESLPRDKASSLERFHIRDKHIDSGDEIPANYLGKQISAQPLGEEQFKPREDRA